ncbi:uncharacterized protein LOC114530084 [Dendronephthya gigantea]|nr:uncharacterized protein LOC114530084 [Dendronephthya gigantea]
MQSLFMELDECDSTNVEEMENRCIFASLPHVLGEKKSKSIAIGELFWKIVDITEGATNITKVIEQSSTPRLVSAGTVLNVESLCLAAEGMVVCKFGPVNAILNAVVTLLASFYVFNASYPGGLPKNIFTFLEHVLELNTTHSSLPIAVDNFMSEIN